MEHPLVLIPPAIAFVVFLTLGIVCWSYRDVYNRHSDRPDYKGTGANNHHDAGH